MKLNLVIPAAGRGSRFRDVGQLTPKPMIPILGLPMINWVIGNFSLDSADKIWIVSQKADNLPTLLGPYLIDLPNEVSFIEIHGVTDGAASTFELALKEIPELEPVICANSDQFVKLDLNDFVSAVRNQEEAGQILTMKASGDKWSYIQRNSLNEVTKIVEKVQVSEEATVGIYGWSSAKIAADSIHEMKKNSDKVKNEYYLAPSYNYLLSSGQLVKTIFVGEIEESVFGLGTPEDLSLFLKKSDLEELYNSVKAKLNPQDNAYG
jgi:NDP-sugar pyrophosphorylase family protein